MALITANEVINGGAARPAPLNARFDAALISPHIADAIREHVLPVVGDAMMATMLSKKNTANCNYNTAVGAIVKAFPASGDAAYETLWTEHLYDLCAWAVMYEALPFISMQTGSNGVFTVSTEFGKSEGVQGVKYLQDQMRRRIEQKTDALKAYLCANSGDFADYDTSNCPDVSCGDTQNNNRMKRYGITYLTND